MVAEAKAEAKVGVVVNAGAKLSAAEVLQVQAFYQYVLGAVRYSYVLVRTGAGGAVPALGRYQVVQYRGHHGTGSTGTETVLKRAYCLRLRGNKENFFSVASLTLSF